MVKKDPADEEGTHVFHFRISNDLHRWLDKKAEELGISAAEYIKTILQFFRKMD